MGGGGLRGAGWCAGEGWGCYERARAIEWKLGELGGLILQLLKVLIGGVLIAILLHLLITIVEFIFTFLFPSYHQDRKSVV